MVKHSKRIPGLSPAEAARRCKALGRKLRKRRLELGLKQAAIARLFGWEPTRLWKYEEGRSLPSTGALEALAKVLQLDSDELFALRNGKNGNGSEASCGAT